MLGVLALVLVSLLLLVLPSPAQATRDAVTFDFGWRWRLGLHSVPKKDAPPDPPSTGPGPNPAEAAATYDDSAWDAVHLPHDGLAAQGASNISCPTGCSGRSFVPRHAMWYRKTFALPAAWSESSSSSADSSVWIEFDGIFHAAIVYLNGEVVARNAEGYLGFHVQLENATGSLRSPGEKNVLAVFVDPDGGAGFSNVARSGWWYEGAGIYRHARMVRSGEVRIAKDGLVARSEISSTAQQQATATLTAAATIENTGHDSTAAGVHVVVTLVEKKSGIIVGEATSTALGAIPAGGSADASVVISVSNPKLWSSRQPELYVVMARVVGATSAGEGGQKTTFDTVNVTHGFRTLVFSGADGTPSCALNGEPFKWRGFCDVRTFPFTPHLRRCAVCCFHA
jgi:beta-galactosidase